VLLSLAEGLPKAPAAAEPPPRQPTIPTGSGCFCLIPPLSGNAFSGSRLSQPPALLGKACYVKNYVFL